MMERDRTTPHQSTISVISGIEAPVPRQTPVQLHNDHPPQVISTERQHIPWLGAHLKPRRQVFLDEGSHAHIIKHSRPNRKNRFAEYLPDEKHWKQLVVVPKWPQVLKLDYENISWHVAIYFTLGSVAWVINGQYAMFPVAGDANLPVNINLMGYSALVGGLLFWVGAYLSIVEALNEKEEVHFGIELRHILDTLEEEPRDIQKFIKKQVRKIEGEVSKGGGGGRHLGACHLHYVLNKNKNNTENSGSKSDSIDGVLPKHEKPLRSWRWWGTETSSLGWWASIIQFAGATAFTISVITGTPGVLSSTQWQLQTALSWTMQVVGSIGFIISSAMLMLEEQREWYVFALDRIGWHSAFWNVIGSIGFLLCAIFGYLANWGGQGEICCQFWGTAFNTYYGSWAFLISSVLLLIEVENKEPTSFDQLMARAAAWVAMKTRCDSEELEEEGEESSMKEGAEV
jgi:hypothetical protein